MNTNDVSNAIKFTPKGGRIEIRIEPEGPAFFRLAVQSRLGEGSTFSAILPRLGTMVSPDDVATTTWSPLPDRA